MTTDIRNNQLLSDGGDTVLEVYYERGNPGFVCGANGAITSSMINDIEKDFLDNPDEFFSYGDGYYLFIPRWETPQYGDEGRIELHGYWDLEQVGFKKK